MKKIIMILCITCSMLLSQGCNNTGSTSNSDTTSKTQNIDNSNNSTNQTNEARQIGEKEDNTFQGDLNVDEQVIFENDQAKITVKSLTKVEYELKLKVDIENKSDQVLTFYSGVMSYARNTINNTSVESGYINETIQPGKIAAVKVYFDLDELKVMGIQEISSVGLDVQVEDEDGDELFTTGLLEIKTGNQSYDIDNDSLDISDGLINSLNLVKIYEDPNLDEKLGSLNVSNIVVYEQEKHGDLVLVEVNNTGSDDIDVILTDISINGFRLRSSNWTGQYVIQGNRAVLYFETYYVLGSEHREKDDFKSIDNIEFTLTAVDEDYDTIGDKTFSVELKKGHETSMNKKAIVYDEGGILVEFKGLEKDEYNGYNLNFVIFNNSKQEIIVDTKRDTLSIDSYMCNELTWSRTVPASQKAFLTIEILDSYLEDAGIEDIENFETIEFNLNIKDEDYDTVGTPHIVIENK